MPASIVLKPRFTRAKIESVTYDLSSQYTNRIQEEIKAGTVVRLELPIWPGGMAFDTGGLLAIKFSGYYISLMDMKSLNGQTIAENKGHRILHFGGRMDSYIELPLSAPFER